MQRQNPVISESSHACTTPSATGEKKWFSLKTADREPQTFGVWYCNNPEYSGCGDDASDSASSRSTASTALGSHPKTVNSIRCESDGQCQREKPLRRAHHEYTSTPFIQRCSEPGAARLALYLPVKQPGKGLEEGEKCPVSLAEQKKILWKLRLDEDAAPIPT